MGKDEKIKHSINVLAAQYVKHSGMRVSHDEAKKRVIKALSKGGK